MLSDERSFVARVAVTEAVLDVQTDAVERSHYRAYKWWIIAEMAASWERFLPPDLPALLRPIVLGDLPAQPIRLR